MPSLASRFRTFDSFARATLSEIYASPRLDEFLRLEVNTLDSGVFRNDGRGRFDFEPFPRVAQISPGYGVVVTDCDADGHADLCLAQNFFGPQMETGRYDSGIGQVLRGKGDGSFEAVPPHTSGLVVPGDAASLTVADVNRDGRPDLVVGLNNGHPMVFENRGIPVGRPLHVRLVGRQAGNPHAVGARVTLRLKGELPQTCEIAAGGGYLSQSMRSLVFGLPGESAGAEIEIVWPDGSKSRHSPERLGGLIVIRQPK